MVPGFKPVKETDYSQNYEYGTDLVSQVVYLPWNDVLGMYINTFEALF